MTKTIIHSLIFIIFIVLAGCKTNKICSAYQSYFLLDKTKQENNFAYIALDSLPRRDVSYTTKNKNGIVAKNQFLAYVDSDWEVENKMKKVDMKVIYPQPFDEDLVIYSETNIIDSSSLEDIQPEQEIFHYNVDQKYYNWYFKNKLIWKDELVDKDKQLKVEGEENLNGEKKSWQVKLKELFSFKKKEEEPKVEGEENLNSEKKSWQVKLKEFFSFKKKEEEPKVEGEENLNSEKKSWQVKLKELFSFKKKDKQPKKEVIEENINRKEPQLEKNEKIKRKKSKKENKKKPVLEEEKNDKKEEDDDDGEDDF